MSPQNPEETWTLLKEKSISPLFLDAMVTNERCICSNFRNNTHLYCIVVQAGFCRPSKLEDPD